MEPPKSKLGDDDDPSNQMKSLEEGSPSQPPPPQPLRQPSRQPPKRQPTRPSPRPSSANSARRRRHLKALSIGASVVVGLGVAATVAWVAVERADPLLASIQQVDDDSKKTFTYSIKQDLKDYARNLCGSGSNSLAMPKTEDQADALKKFLDDNKASLPKEPSLAWIGVDDKDQSDVQWADGSTFTPTTSLGSIQKDTAKRDCGTIYLLGSSWKIVFEDCTLNLRYVCQTDEKVTTTVKPANSSDDEEEDIVVPTTTPEPGGLDPMIIIGVVVVLVALGGGVYWYKKKEQEEKRQAAAARALALEMEKKKEEERKKRKRRRGRSSEGSYDDDDDDDDASDTISSLISFSNSLLGGSSSSGSSARSKRSKRVRYDDDDE